MGESVPIIIDSSAVLTCEGMHALCAARVHWPEEHTAWVPRVGETQALANSILNY